MNKPQKSNSQTFNNAANKPSAPKSKRPAPVSVRFSAEERASLEKAAAGIPLSRYIRKRVLSKRAVSKDGCDPVLLGQILGALKASDMLNGLHELEWAERNGKLSLDDHSAHALRSACLSVTQMRADLLRSLGLREHDP